jgi:hypothetical protein
MPRLPKEAFAAFVGIDWADAKHAVWEVYPKFKTKKQLV